jgi:hypothetical protein
LTTGVPWQAVSQCSGVPSAAVRYKIAGTLPTPP